MQQLVEKKLKQLKKVADKHCKQNVKQQLAQANPKMFADLNKLTEWFIKTISKEEPRFREQFTKFQAEQALWVEAYKYIKADESPDYLPIHDLLLDIYDMVEFYPKDPNKEVDLGKLMIFKLMIVNNAKPEIKSLVKTIEQKKNQIVQKKEAPKTAPAPPPAVHKPAPPPAATAPQVSKPKPPTAPTAPSVHRPRQPQAFHPPIQTPNSRRPPPNPPTIPTLSQYQNLQARLAQEKARESLPIRQAPQPVHPPTPQPVRQTLVSRPVQTKHVRQMKTHDQHRAISDILMERRDLEFVDLDAKKEVIGLLVVQLNTYMKNFMERLVKVAKIHNPSNNRYGDQFRYFSKVNQLKLGFEMPIDTKVKISFFKIRFPDKLSIYSTLRNSQQVEQNKLRVQDTKKRKQNQKQIIEYVRGEHRVPKTRAFHDQNTVSDKLSVKLSMVQMLMQTDPTYADSELLRRSYLS